MLALLLLSSLKTISNLFPSVSGLPWHKGGGWVLCAFDSFYRKTQTEQAGPKVPYTLPTGLVIGFGTSALGGPPLPTSTLLQKSEWQF